MEHESNNAPTPLLPQSLLTLMFKHHVNTHCPYSVPHAIFAKNLAFFDKNHWKRWWRWHMVEIVSINTILQQYQTIFLIHKIQDTVLDLMYHN